MLAAVLYGAENLRLEEVDEPTPEPGEVVIEVGVATTCGTDLKVWRRGGHSKMLRPPTLFGHEASGKIVALGQGVEDWSLGDRVVPNNSAPCMTCFFCQRREFSLCPNLTWNNGTFAKYLKIPAPIVQHNLLKTPPHLPDEIASMTEPLACVLHGIARSNLQEGDRVVLIGDGGIGLMFVAALSYGFINPEEDQGTPIMGKPSEIIVFGGNAQRLRIAEKLGATKTFNYHQIHQTIPQIVKKLTDGWGADIVIECTGVPSVWETAIASGRPGSTINLFGGCPQSTTINVSTEPLHYNELTLKGVFHNTPEYFRMALFLLANRQIPWSLLISEQRSLLDLQEVFYAMRERHVIKVAMTVDS